MQGTNGIIFLVFLCFIIILVYIERSIRVVKSGEVAIIERFGKYNRTCEAGLIVIIPIIEKIKVIVNVKEFKKSLPTRCFAKDSDSPITVFFSASYKIIDPVKATYNTNDLSKTAVYRTQKAIENEIRELNYNEVTSYKERICERVIDKVQELQEEFGVAVVDFKLTDILYPKDNPPTIQNDEKSPDTKLYSTMDELFEKYSLDDES